MGELQPGSKVAGKYTLIGRVGRGGMGDVWIARNEATHADVAIKTLRPDRRAIEQAEERFRQEAKVSARLAHPHIARIYDLVEEADGTLLLIMERLRGETLKDKLLAAPIDCNAAVELILPILDALGAAHDAGIVHRDVTPANILLAEEAGRVIPKLIDFGVAKAVDNTIETKAGHALGTPQYMSPEQIRSGTVDGRSDLFSLSVTLFEAITGVSPFKRSSASGSLAAVLESDVDPDPKITPTVWLVLSRGLAKQSYERHSSAQEMARALKAAIEPAKDELPPHRAEHPSLASDELSGQISLRPPAPRPKWPLFAAIGALGLIIGLATVTVFKKEKPAGASPAPPSSIPVQTLAAIATPAPTIPPPPAPTSTTSASETGKPVLPMVPVTTTVKRPPTGKPQGGATTKPVATTPGF